MPINWPQGVSPKPALRLAREAIAKAAPAAAAAKAGCDYDGQSIRVPLLDRTYSVRLPEALVSQAGETAPVPEGVQLVLLHYLLNADGTPPAGIWVTYRHLPDGLIFEQRFNAMAVEPLVRTFGADRKGFRCAAERLGGAPMTRTGDVAYRFLALPQIPMGVILYLADEEMAASVNIVFDAAAPQYLCTEDLAWLGLHLSESLLKAASGET